MERMNGNHDEKNIGIALFGAGCFWGVEYIFLQVPGVISTKVGYSGGKTKDPNYRDVIWRETSHAEVVKVVFDKSKIDYSLLLDVFFRCHDPTTKDRQGPDVGDQYRSVIFYTDQSQLKSAKNALARYQKILGKKKIVTEIKKAGVFYPAEGYHQDYYGKVGGTPYCHVMPNLSSISQRGFK